MRKTAALALFATIALLPAATTSAAWAQAIAAPPEAGADMPPESRIAAATALLRATHAVQNVGAMLDTLMPLQKAQLKRARPNLSDAAIEASLLKMRDAILARQDEMLRLYSIEYARHFSEQELRDLAAFYQSDVGKKYIALVPVLLKESVPLMTRWVLGVITQEEQNILKTLPQQDKKT
jgi:hypothetical protein